MRVVALAGGVGGAKLADGLARVLAPTHLTVIVNTGDDFDHLGLRICPDLDTVCYTLAGIANPETGWGQKGETWHALESLVHLGGPGWFRIGDLDLGTHLERTRRLQAGQGLAKITTEFCQRWGVLAQVLPMTDDRVATIVQTVEMGELPFQVYFVEHQCRPTVTGFRFAGIETARMAPGVSEALERAELIVICPSNPWVSISPILQVPGLRSIVETKPVAAVSPIIQGKAVKGPAAKMYAELGWEPSALTVARHYGPLLAGFILDRTDAPLEDAIRQSGIIPYATNTLMVSSEDRYRLADDVVSFGETLTRRANGHMSLWAIVPVKPLRRGKSRLAGVLSEEERTQLNFSMLANTLKVLSQVPEIDHTLVVSRDPAALALARDYGAKTLLEDGSPQLNTALRRATAVAQAYANEGILILPADLPLLNIEDIKVFISHAGQPPVVVIGPDRHGTGTNALLVSPAGVIDYSFGPGSCQRHCDRATKYCVRLEVCDLSSIALDLDTPEDLEYLRHLEGIKAG